MHSVSLIVYFFSTQPEIFVMTSYAENSKLTTVATCFMLGIFFDPEDVGDISSGNICRLLADYMALYPRR
jgi:hypothetical protein